MRQGKVVALGLALVLGTLILTGCSAKPLPDGMEEESVSQAADEVLDQLVHGNYQEVADAFRTDMQEEYNVTAQVVEETMEITQESGAFKKVSDRVITGGDQKVFTEPFAVAVLYCEHENGDVIYEFSFDTGLELIGLSIQPK
ncbi:MAG: DUF3887 domain-containing protein [Lawsonibacter sp.]|jgi:ssDNA-binding replication factor A large subunit